MKILLADRCTLRREPSRKTHARKRKSCQGDLTKCQGLCRSDQVHGALQKAALWLWPWTEQCHPDSVHRLQVPGATGNRNNAKLCLPQQLPISGESGRQATRIEQFGRKPAFCKPQGQEVHTHQRVPHHTLGEGRASQRGWNRLFPSLRL